MVVCEAMAGSRYCLVERQISFLGGVCEAGWLIREE